MRTALPSNRSFGWFFTGIFVLAAALWHPWVLAVAALTALVTLTRATWLTPLNRAWMALGELMGRVVSPIVLGIIFFGLFAPVGMVMRLFKRDALSRSFDAAARSYWVERTPPGPPEGSFRDMF
jgi:hypothetical protein